jgi:hypothetical protein
VSTNLRDTYDTDVREDERSVVTGQRPLGSHSGTQVGENVMPVRNRVQWGPIIAGVLTSIATLLILSVLGLAIGASVFEPRDAGESIGTGAAIWGALSAIVAFFLGGWVAAKTAAVGGPGSGMINGLMVGATILALLLWLVGSGIASIVGAIGSNIVDIANLAQDQGQTAQQAQQQAQTADPQQAFENVRDSAWGTLAGLLLPLIAAAVGGYLGHNTRRELIEGTR